MWALCVRVIASGKGLQDGLGRVEPDLGLEIVLQASEGVEEQQGLVRCPSAVTSEAVGCRRTWRAGSRGRAVPRGVAN